MKTFKIEAPWYTFGKKVKALFAQDKDIRIGDVVPVDIELGKGADDYDYNFVMDIEVLNHEKYIALDRVIPKHKSFGGVTLKIQIFDEENTLLKSGMDIYHTIFKGNPIVRDIIDTLDFTETPHAFVRFEPKVVQFFDDDLSDYNGNWTGLAEDIARELFLNDMSGVHFCTAPLDEE